MLRTRSGNVRPGKRARSSVAPRRLQFGRAPSIPRGVRAPTSGFPNQLIMKHKYHQEFILTSTTGSPAPGSKYFSTNGMFDPEIGIAGGHQPSYFDTLSALYDFYCVSNAFIQVEISPVAAVGGLTPQGTAGIFIDSDSNLGASALNSLIEQSTGTSRCTAIGNGYVKLSKKWSSKQAFGTKGLGDPSISGTGAANPVDIQNFVVFVRNSDIAAATATYAVSVTVWYTATWSQVKDHNGS